MDDAELLVAGVGNLFLGDDGFGPEVARRLIARGVPDRVRVTDYGVGGIHLTYDLLDGFRSLVIVDVISGDQEPGTVRVLEVEPAGDDAPPLDAHAMDPARVLASVRRLGCEPPRTLVVAVEPASLAEGIGLSPAIAAAVDPTVDAVTDLLTRELDRIDATDRSPVATVAEES